MFIKNLIYTGLTVVEYLIIARCVLSFIPALHNNIIVDSLFRITDPILEPARKLIERLFAGKYLVVDFSPVVTYLFILVIRFIIRVI